MFIAIQSYQFYRSMNDHDKLQPYMRAPVLCYTTGTVSGVLLRLRSD